MTLKTSVEVSAGVIRQRRRLTENTSANKINRGEVADTGWANRKAGGGGVPSIGAALAALLAETLLRCIQLSAGKTAAARRNAPLTFRKAY